MSKFTIPLLLLVSAALAYLNMEDVSLPPLSYSYQDLEPVIDEATMKVHHQGKKQICLLNFRTSFGVYQQFEQGIGYDAKKGIFLFEKLQRGGALVAPHGPNRTSRYQNFGAQ